MTFKEILNLMNVLNIEAGQAMTAQELNDYLNERKIVLDDSTFNTVCNIVYNTWRDFDYPRSVYHVIKAYHKLSPRFDSIPSVRELIDLATYYEDEEV